jgi:hypothetical protein
MASKKLGETSDAKICSARPSESSARVTAADAATASKARLVRRRSSNSVEDRWPSGWFGLFSITHPSRSTSRNASGWKSSASIAENATVFAPTPTASVRTASAASAGRRSRLRTA